GGTGRIDNFTVTATMIPEPSALALVGLGVAGLVAFRRRNG
ncbi:MAG TPA: VPLPA-CTERM sorting domain-containing protein, partial [Verrucomicrobia subdivision 3 bacterium]|nr:VPLPA-CTERM sorting domain-containing protein [Limisphaerales bacterium]